MGKKGPLGAVLGAVVGGILGGPGGAHEKQAKSAMEQAQKNADAAAKRADEDFNRANQKRPDTNAILAAAQDSVRGGTSGTMLTGAQGVDPETLKLGKTTLLGG